MDLRPLKEKDLDGDYPSWLADKEVTRYLETGRHPIRREELKAYLDRFGPRSADLCFAIVDKATGLHVGNVTLNHVNQVNRTADTGLLIGRKEFWGKGYAFEAWTLVIEHAFQRLGLRKVIAGVIAGNAASEATLRKLGFQLEGTFREEAFVDGEHRDVLRFGMFREEFHKLKDRS